MFDIAASELLIIAVVALIVIGPERLPRVARTLGHLFGRMQRYVNDVKADIQREVELDELRKLKQTVEDSARSIETSVNQELNGARDEVRNLEALVQAQETVPPARAESGADSTSPASARVGDEFYDAPAPAPAPAPASAPTPAAAPASAAAPAAFPGVPGRTNSAPAPVPAGGAAPVPGANATPAQPSGQAPAIPTRTADAGRPADAKPG